MVIKIQKTIEIFILFCFILLFVPHAGIVQVVVRMPRTLPKNMDEPPHHATASPTHIPHLEIYI